MTHTLALATLDDTPLTYEQATAGPEKERWRLAIDDELKSHQKNKTWVIVKKKPDMNIIGCKWVFKKKKDVHGEVARYKARLVAKGFKQEYGVDYLETFAPVLKYKSLRILLALAASSNNIVIDQMDIKTAFINAEVDGDIYVELPEGVAGGDGMVLKLLKALYGIKQAPHLWNNKIDGHLKKLGFKQCLKDSCIYILTISNSNNNFIMGNSIIIGLFVDDLLIFYHLSNSGVWKKIKQQLQSAYEMSDMGAASHVLGMHVQRLSNGDIILQQNVYLREKLIEYGMHKSSAATTPAAAENNNTPATDTAASPGNAELFRSIVGSLIYAAVSTRPDLTHAVNTCSRHLQQPQHSHVTSAKRMLRYVRGTTEHGLRFKKWQGEKDVATIIGYSDADWGGDKNGRRSTTGYCVLINNNLISWNTKKQPTVALSTAEAELMAMVEVVKEVMWVQQLMDELNITIATPTIRVDNQSAIKMSENDTHHDRSKHIDIRYYFVREAVKTKAVSIEWVPSEEQLADIFTKCLGRQVFERLRDRLVERVLDEEK